ncbi:uncharacterized protein LOC134262335 [Saccostrea cucullata]|uniref:uncharacterized protein LOC134262335 n=1 Tax=Saccostrea cuccullata TaxID=36930 RepID=UPI002ED3FB11
MSLYNVTLLGLDDGTFYPLHVSAIVCMSCSLLASIVVTALSFKTHKKGFYLWPRSERFVVYLALCEASFNFIHMFDHVTMITERDHVHPLELCQFYAFLMVLLVTTKNLVLVIIAINGFLLIRFQRQMEFGTRDWRLFAVTLGIPSFYCSVALSFQQLGPAGAFCLVIPGISTFLMTIIPFILILLVNTTLYSLTWFHIRRDAQQIRSVIGAQAQSGTSYIQAAKTMTMFITVFTIQWWAVTVYGIWQIISHDVPSIVYIFVVIFTNIGGCLNLIVFISIQKKRRRIVALDTKVQTSRLPVNVTPFQVNANFTLQKMKAQNTNSTGINTSSEKIEHHSIADATV